MKFDVAVDKLALHLSQLLDVPSKVEIVDKHKAENETACTR